MKLRTFLTTLLVIASFVFGMTGCTPKTIAKAKKASSKLATYANNGVNVTRDIYQQKLISLELKDKIADGFVKLSAAGIAFDAAVKNAESVYGPNVPATEVERLFAVFDQSVVAQFLAVVASLKLISDVPSLEAVIATIKTAILVIADAFGKKVVVAAEVH
jgi:hypothetical protein